MTTLKILFLAVVLAACSPAEPAAPADPASPVTGSTDTSGPTDGMVLADTLRADLSGVPDSLRSCIPEAFAERPVRFEYVGQMSPAGQPTKVLLEYFDDADPASVLGFSPVILNVRASGCSTEDRPDARSDAVYDEADLLLTNPTIMQRHAELHILTAGGPEAYADLYRSSFSRDLRECRAGEEARAIGCVSPPEATAYRALGVPID